MEPVVFFQADQLVVWPELFLNLRESLKVGVDPFHCGLVLVHLGTFANSSLYSLFELAEDKECRVHLIDRGYLHGSIELLLD